MDSKSKQIIVQYAFLIVKYKMYQNEPLYKK